MNKKLILPIFSAFLLLTACSEKTQYPEIVPPKIITSDGETIELPIGTSTSSVSEKFGKKLCSAAGVEYSEEALSKIRFGENVYGADLAAVVYFGKSAEKLSDEQQKMLCSIAREPQKYSAVLSGESDEEGYNSHISQASRIPENAYFDAMIEEIVRDYCAEYGTSRAEAFRVLYSDGVTVKSPYSAAVQENLNSVYSDDACFTADTSKSFPQSACAIIGYDGGVSAISGGNHGNRSYNRGYRIPHKIGSSIKPIAVYAPALDSGLINFSSLVPDEPLQLKNEVETIEWPQNHDGLYEGNITVTAALRTSKNTVAVHLEELLGSQNCLDRMRNDLHFTTLTQYDASPSAMALGALYDGVYLHELAASYVMFGNGGVHFDPYFYTEVLDSEGRVILKKEITSNRVLKSDSAWIMNRLLRYNISAEGAIASAAELSDGTEVIGKTGTVVNSQNMDSGRLFVGATPEYVAAVWVGYDDDESSIESVEYTPPTIIWRSVMERISADNKNFVPDDSVIECAYCTESGGIAQASCPKTEVGYYSAENMPQRCTLHR